MLDVDEIKSDCDPIVRNKDVKDGLMNYDGSKTLNPEGPAFPCGLVAKSYFTDSYALYKDGTNITVRISNM